MAHMIKICFRGFLRCQGSRPLTKNGKIMKGLFCHKTVSTNLLTVQFRSCSTASRYGVVTPLFLQANKHADRVALVDHYGSYRYDDLLLHANVLTDKILDYMDTTSGDTNGERICLVCPNDVSYVVAQWATWMSGSITVPLSPSHPVSQLEHFVKDSQSKLIIVTEEFAEKVEPIASQMGINVLTLNKESFNGNLKFNGIDEDTEKTLAVNRERRWSERLNRFKQLRDENMFKQKSAMIVYTSGTTGTPKGVVHTFGSLHSQMLGMIDLWKWSSSDVILHALPLNHVHGIVNVLMTPLFSGACCVMLPQFDPQQVWNFLLSPANLLSPEIQQGINVFMAVPTMYAKLIDYYDQRLNRGQGTKYGKDFIRALFASKIRLFVSGSSALPTPIMNRWEDITGHCLLERYGMTELGMGLTNPLEGPRIPGAVGLPFPRVEVCIAKPDVSAKNGLDVLATGNWKKASVIPGHEKEAGELYVRGDNLFKEYWNMPDVTKEAFTKDGWFKTGDTAILEDGVFRILGRTSVDIIKSGGYKISAIEVERHLLSHPSIADVAVVGIPDITWGQRVAAAIVVRPGISLDLKELVIWMKERLPLYQMPTVIEEIEKMPRNAMGKVSKKTLMQQVFRNFF